MKLFFVLGPVVSMFLTGWSQAQLPTTTGDPSAPTATATTAPPAAASPAPTAPPSTEDDETRLLGIERDWHNACLHGDTDYLTRLLADDFVQTDEHAQTRDKPEVLRQVHERTVHYTVYENHDVTVRLHGDTAVVTGSTRVKGIVAATGKSLDAEEKFTDVFARLDGQWHALATHTSRAAAAGRAEE